MSDNFNLDEIRAEVIRRSDPIPFGNSDKQNDYFVEYAQLTGARGYRAILLKLNARLNDVKEYQFVLEKLALDIEKWQQIKKSWLKSQRSKKLADIEMRHAESQLDYQKKLLKDAVFEINHLYKKLKYYREYTRDEFENEETAHFKLMMQRKMSLPQGKEGVAESILNLEADHSNFIYNLALPASSVELMRVSTFQQQLSNDLKLLDNIERIK